MNSDSFDLIEQAVRSAGPKAGLDLLARKLSEEKNYQLLFEARMMRKRHELGMPLVQMGPSDDIPEEKRAAYEQAFTESAREIGERKAANVLSVGADVLVSANPGCTLQIGSILRARGASLRAAHPIEILDASINGAPGP